MQCSFRLALGAAILIAPAFGADCDRACLKGVLDQYLSAVIQHDPSAVPLTPGYRQTENAVVRRPGQGIWQTAKALGKVQRRYFDPVTQNAAYFGTLEEASGNAAVVTVRLKVADRKVSEAEWYLARKGDPGIGVGAGAQANNAFWDPEYLAAHSPVERMVPKAERVSREDLIAITNSYFDSLSARDGHIMIAHPGCVRLENGVITTQRDAPANPPANAAGIFNGKTDCMNEGAMTNIYAVVARRFPVQCSGWESSCASQAWPCVAISSASGSSSTKASCAPSIPQCSTRTRTRWCPIGRPTTAIGPCCRRRSSGARLTCLPGAGRPYCSPGRCTRSTRL
jgi:hypothetical protein